VNLDNFNLENRNLSVNKKLISVLEKSINLQEWFSW